MKKTIDQMDNFEVSRWLALVEAVNIIDEECHSRKRNFDALRLEPLTIRKYIEGTCDIFCRKLNEEKERKASYISQGF